MNNMCIYFITFDANNHKLNLPGSGVAIGRAGGADHHKGFSPKNKKGQNS